jgi:para-aminobenzoate synthetase component 1
VPVGLRFRPVEGPAPSPGALLARAQPEDQPAALVSGPGAAELSRWSCFVQSPVTVTADLDAAARFADRLADDLAVSGPLPFEVAETLPFLGGALGHISYDAGWRFAPRARRPRPHPLGLPEARFGLFDAAYLRDATTGAGFVVHRDDTDAAARGGALLACVARARDPAPVVAGGLGSPLVPRVPRAEHERRIRRALHLIAEGEAYQVNLTLPLVGGYDGDPRAAFLRLTEGAATAPPFAAYLGLGAGRAIVSGSPECFFTWRRDGFARTYPIKGTRPRSADVEVDRSEAARLLASEKDRAEHLMIVDLLRNDLGRLARAGGVDVEAEAYLESFPTVHHLTSRVAARLEPGLGAADVFRGLFPGGSITGAPKLRAMEIIDELEDDARGVYTGSIVAMGPLGTVANIAIRTAEIAAGAIRLGVGGGIVYDSDPASEWDECEVKARAMSAALARG